MSHSHDTRGKNRASDDPPDVPATKRTRLTSDETDDDSTASSSDIYTANTTAIQIADNSTASSSDIHVTTATTDTTAIQMAAADTNDNQPSENTETTDSQPTGNANAPANQPDGNGDAVDDDAPANTGNTEHEHPTDHNAPDVDAIAAAPIDGFNPIYATMTFPPHIDDPLTQHRLLDILSFADPTKNRFNIGLFPDNTKWAASPNGGRGPGAERLLSIGTTPAVCWIVGSVRFVQTKNGRYVIGVEPLSPHDAVKAKAIQYGKARPSRTPNSKSQLVYASKFLNNGAFDETYDATDELLAWTDMQDNKVSSRHIRQTDVVLLECLIRRYPPANAPSNNAWGVFSIAFELARIARIIVGPGIPDYLPD